MKYSKITQKCTLLEQRATGIVTQQYKKFGGAKSKKKCLPSVRVGHSAYNTVCRVSKGDTRYRCVFAECCILALGI